MDRCVIRCRKGLEERHTEECGGLVSQSRGSPPLAWLYLAFSSSLVKFGQAYVPSSPLPRGLGSAWTGVWCFALGLLMMVYLHCTSLYYLMTSPKLMTYSSFTTAADRHWIQVLQSSNMACHGRGEEAPAKRQFMPSSTSSS